MNGLSLRGLVHELRRRHTFRTAGLYIVGAWLVMQAADVFFPAWGLPGTAINVLLATAILGFPLALVFGWFFDISADGIVRTPAADSVDTQTPLSLQRRDFIILGALGLIAAYIVYDGVQDIVRAPRVAEAEPVPELALPETIEHSIAVLPFVNTSNDPDNEVFCDGMSEEILHKLSKYSELHVIGRTSSFAFKGSDYRIPRIAALLGVRYLLQGSVRRDGNQLRILASLVDAAGTQKWSDSFDRELESVFAIQSEIADVVAATVVPQIVPVKDIDYQPDPVAYQQYLVGRDLLRRRDLGAAQALEAATELDPKFAAAHAELAIALMIGTTDLERAEVALETALALDSDLPRALSARGLLLLEQVPPEYTAAEDVIRRALARNPNDVDAMNWLASVLLQQDRYDESLDVMERAARLDPLHGSVISNLARRYINRGDDERAEKMLLRVLEVPEPSRGPFITLRNLYLETGRLVEMNALEKRQALIGVNVYFGLALSYAVLGLWDDAAQWTALVQEDFPDFRWVGLYPALLPSWRGDYAEAAKRFPKGADLPRDALNFFGEYQALAGEFDGAVTTLEPLLSQVDSTINDPQIVGFHALAWAYLATGRQDEALHMLENIEQQYAAEDARGLLHDSGTLFEYARNALLLGNHDAALDRLEIAIDAGWRQYEIERNDPRWADLAEHPRYVALMQTVTEDVARQRAAIERIDAEGDFMERFEAARRLRH